jgi:hypothetical protein
MKYTISYLINPVTANLPKGRDAKPRVYSGHRGRYDGRVADITFPGSLVLCVQALVSFMFKNIAGEVVCPMGYETG